ncbi:MAG: hypothetical protein HUU21_28150 [Polyangiaceae bacterium]|nr:hypothetical protein [Polyangiaceae bacterium]
MTKYMIAILAVSISALAACGGGAEGGEGAKTPETTAPAGGEATPPAGGEATPPPADPGAGGEAPKN